MLLDLLSEKDISYDVIMRNRKAKQTRIHKEPRTGDKTQTTLRLPQKLYEQAKLLVERERNGSMNDFVVAALTAYVHALERRAIDDAFRGMAQDKEYQRETLQIMREFAASDGETIALSERDLLGT